MGMYDMGMPDLGVCRGGMHNIVMQSIVKIKPTVPTLYNNNLSIETIFQPRTRKI
jgi:hypothetical protein